LKSRREQMEIIALYEELGSYRAVAALLGCDHKTVKRCVGLAGELGQLAPARRRARITDDYRELIRERVEQTRGRITSRQLLRLVRAAGYRGSERSLRRAVAEEKRAFRSARRAGAGVSALAVHSRRVAHLRLGSGGDGGDAGGFEGGCRSFARCWATRTTGS
jgi:hypothetical protein